jgi:hypothetical protein
MSNLRTTQLVVEAIISPYAYKKITISPPFAIIQTPGSTLQLSAVATYSDGSTLDITGQVAWATSDTAIMTVSSTGLLTAIDTGLAIITATTVDDGAIGAAYIGVDADATPLSGFALLASPS